ncbi:hypothetical protein EMIHUDRAFT_452052, partial [Emiliania huxleyi CCMP1516]|uniref:Uncharacterized protein n=2 Tax=Emiliania huxleyi TaxID=2903 RepID=A0A0D3IPJ5_EMIH1
RLLSQTPNTRKRSVGRRTKPSGLDRAVRAASQSHGTHRVPAPPGLRRLGALRGHTRRPPAPVRHCVGWHGGGRHARRVDGQAALVPLPAAAAEVAARPGRGQDGQSGGVATRAAQRQLQVAPLAPAEHDQRALRAAAARADRTAGEARRGRGRRGCGGAVPAAPLARAARPAGVLSLARRRFRPAVDRRLGAGCRSDFGARVCAGVGREEGGAGGPVHRRALRADAARELPQDARELPHDVPKGVAVRAGRVVYVCDAGRRCVGGTRFVAHLAAVCAARRRHRHAEDQPRPADPVVLPAAAPLLPAPLPHHPRGRTQAGFDHCGGAVL